ncbi:hypothetical protein [Acetobacter syzygii]|nr:hypothetical protein [Acetobacter syzygii]
MGGASLQMGFALSGPCGSAFIPKLHGVPGFLALMAWLEAEQALCPYRQNQPAWAILAGNGVDGHQHTTQRMADNSTQHSKGCGSIACLRHRQWLPYHSLSHAMRFNPRTGYSQSRPDVTYYPA